MTPRAPQHLPPRGIEYDTARAQATSDKQQATGNTPYFLVKVDPHGDAQGKSSIPSVSTASAGVGPHFLAKEAIMVTLASSTARPAAVYILQWKGIFGAEWLLRA